MAMLTMNLMDKLPIELMEQVLMKSFVLKHVPFYKRTHQSRNHKTVYETLTSVCATWRTVPKCRPWFAQTLRLQHDKLENLGEYLHCHAVNIVVFCLYVPGFYIEL